MENKKLQKNKETKEKIEFIKKSLKNEEVCKQIARRLTNYIKSSNA